MKEQNFMVSFWKLDDANAEVKINLNDTQNKIIEAIRDDPDLKTAF